MPPTDKPTDKPAPEAPSFPTVKVLDEMQKTQRDQTSTGSSKEEKGAGEESVGQFRLLLNRADNGLQLPDLKLVHGKKEGGFELVNLKAPPREQPKAEPGPEIRSENGHVSRVNTAHNGSFEVSSDGHIRHKYNGRTETITGKLGADDKGNAYLYHADTQVTEVFNANGTTSKLYMRDSQYTQEPTIGSFDRQDLRGDLRLELRREQRQNPLLSYAEKFESVREESDGSKIITDSNGERKAIEQQNGNVLLFKDGKLTSITTIEGTLETHDGGRTWRYGETPLLVIGGDNPLLKPQTHWRPVQAHVEADIKGNVDISFDNGHQLRLNADGTSEWLDVNGVRCVNNSGGKPVHKEFPNGAVEKYEYDRGYEFRGNKIVEKFDLVSKTLTPGESSVALDYNGNPARVTYPNGEFRDLQSDSKGNATITDTDGHKYKGTVEKDGTLHFSLTRENQTLDYTIKPDGTYVATGKQQDGKPFEVKGLFDKPTEITNARGLTQITYDKKGDVQDVTCNGETIRAGIGPFAVQTNRNGDVAVANKTASYIFKNDGTGSSKGIERNSTVEKLNASESQEKFSTLADLNKRLAIRNEDSKFAKPWNWTSSTVDDLRGVMSPSVALSLRSAADGMPPRLREETLAQELQSIQSGNPAERLNSVQMIGALGHYAGEEHVKALAQFQGETGKYKLVESGMTDKQAEQFQRLAGQALLRIADSDKGVSVSLDHASAVLRSDALVRVPGDDRAAVAAIDALKQSWPGLENEQTRSALVSYAEGDIVEFSKSAEAQNIAYEVGMTPPLAETFRTMGVPGSAEELMEKAQQASQNYGKATVENVLSNVARINSLTPALRQELTGAAHELNPLQVVGQLETKGIDNSTPTGKALLSNMNEWLTAKEKSISDSMRSTESDLRLEQSELKRTLKDLDHHTKENAVSLWQRLKYCATFTGDIDKFASEQSKFCAQIPKHQADRQQTMQQMSALVMDRESLKLAERVGYQFESTYRDEKLADMQALAVVADTPKQVLHDIGKSVLTSAEESMARLHEVHNAQLSSIPTFNPKDFNSSLDFIAGLHSENAEGLRQSDRTALQKLALDAIDADPTMKKFQFAAAQIAEHGSTFHSLFETGLGGTRYEDFVKLAKKEAGAIDSALNSITAEDIRVMNNHIQDIDKALAKMDPNAEPEAFKALQDKAEALHKMLEIVDPNSRQNNQLKDALNTVLRSDKFDESTFSNWIVKDGPVVLASVAAATAVIVATAGTGAPVALTIFGMLAAPAAGMAAAEVVQDIEYGLGARKDSGLALDWARGKEVYDNETGKFRQTEFINDVAATYGKQYARDLAITVATLGLGKGLSAAVNSTGGPQALTRLLAANRTALSRTATAMEEIESAVSKQVVKQSFAREFSRQFLQMSGMGATQALGEDSLNSLLKGESQILIPVLVGTLLTAAHGVNFHPNARNTRVKVDMDPSAPEFANFKEFVKQHQENLRRDGNVVEPLGNGSYKVKQWNGKEVTFELSENVARALTHFENAQSLDLQLNETFARAKVVDSTGVVSGNGTVEVFGNSNVELSAPAGQTLRVVVQEGTPQLRVAEGNQGRIEFVNHTTNKTLSDQFKDAAGNPAKNVHVLSPLTEILTPKQIERVLEVQELQDALPKGKLSEHLNANIEALPESQRAEAIALRDAAKVKFDEIVEKVYGDGAAKKEKILHIVVGPPGAGKSSILVDPLSKKHGAFVVDSDHIKPLLDGYEKGLGTNAVHADSAYIGNLVLDKAFANGDNIVYPQLGRTKANLEALIARAKEKGYKIGLHLADLPPDESARRVFNRSEQAPDARGIRQMVDPEFALTTVGRNPALVFEETIAKPEMVDEYSHYDTNVPYEQKAKLVKSSHTPPWTPPTKNP
ncbi:MAG: zeta toxin family protein [Cyanobacteria bacterium SZAS-4]|nr:zeta toxin family protein [Cyanobacteria bacterium SZAS-4]